MALEKRQHGSVATGERSFAAADETRGRVLPMSQQVYFTLRRMLMVGEFRPGESVSIRTLAKRLDTGAMPVREAVTRLIAEQALQMLPNRQVIVPRVTRRKFRELCRVRRALEGMAAEAASEKADAGLLDLLEEHHHQLLRAIEAGNPEQILGKNKDFHFALYEAAESEILMPMIEGMWVQVGPFLFLSQSMGRTSWQATQHSVAMDALRRGDHVGVRHAIQRDIELGAENLMQSAAFDE